MYAPHRSTKLDTATASGDRLDERHGDLPVDADLAHPFEPGGVEDLRRDAPERPQVEQNVERRLAEQRRRHQRQQRVGDTQRPEQPETADEQRRRRDHRRGDGDRGHDPPRPARQPGEPEAGRRGDEHGERHGDGGDDERVHGLGEQADEVEHGGVVAERKRPREQLRRPRWRTRLAQAAAEHEDERGQTPDGDEQGRQVAPPAHRHGVPFIAHGPRLGVRQALPGRPRPTSGQVPPWSLRQVCSPTTPSASSHPHDCCSRRTAFAIPCP